ncbi:MAG: DUF1349 domain-containing protein [Prolixibacteraceae bacterium]|jgi:hypothetical protein
MENKLNLNEFNWLNQPTEFSLDDDRLTIVTDPQTDLWQRTYYGFQNDNAHSFLKTVEGDFTFSVKTEFRANGMYDQCGILLYLDAENWMKASVEAENETISRLGSVVTNLGYSDWATTDIPSETSEVWYRFSRKEQDFYIEYSFDGTHLQQMRMFHVHKLIAEAQVGVYACSPLKSSFEARFSEFKLEPSEWPDYEG